MNEIAHVNDRNDLLVSCGGSECTLICGNRKSTAIHVAVAIERAINQTFGEPVSVIVVNVGSRLIVPSFEFRRIKISI